MKCLRILKTKVSEIYFIKAVFDEVRDRGISVMPTSPEVVGFLRKNRRKYKDLLPVGINI